MFYRLRGQIAQNVHLSLASEYGFSKYSGDVVVDGRNRPQFAIWAKTRAFRDIHVPKLLDIRRNIKKISYSSVRHFLNIMRNLPAKVL
ncbi:MAG: hypothetical protein K2N85_16685 [Lachnospiraceae bacterium]|nr:hypothetical protein [Lachnospiraceae bacterium]